MAVHFPSFHSPRHRYHVNAPNIYLNNCPREIDSLTSRFTIHDLGAVNFFFLFEYHIKYLITYLFNRANIYDTGGKMQRDENCHIFDY